MSNRTLRDSCSDREIANESTRCIDLTFPNQTKIDEAIRALRKLHSGSGIKLYASAVLTKNADGKLSVQKITKEGHGGTAVGALIGALAGLPAGPAAAAIMVAGGAVIGNAADLIAEADFKEFANNIRRIADSTPTSRDVSEVPTTD